MQHINLEHLNPSQLLGLFQESAKRLRDLGFLSYASDGLYTQLSASFLNEDFEELYDRCVLADTRSCLGNFPDTRDKAFRWRLHILLVAAQYALKKSAIFLDLGCGSGMIASALLQSHYNNMILNNVEYHMFDSYSGAEDGDNSSTNFYSTDDGAFEMASSIAESHNAVVKLHRGYLPKALISLDIESLRRVSFISLDLNAANPEINSLKYIINYLPSGCIIILDDFRFPGSKEQNRLHSIFCKNLGLPLFHLPTGQGLIIIGEK